jgi:hypothetical protein
MHSALIEVHLACLISASRRNSELPRASNPTRNTMDNYFETWKVCFDVSLKLQSRGRDCRRKCVGCNALVTYKAEEWRPMFYAVLTGCAAGHIVDSDAVICAVCDVDLIFRITTRQQPCFHPGCKRLWTANITAVKQGLDYPLLERLVTETSNVYCQIKPANQ